MFDKSNDTDSLQSIQRTAELLGVSVKTVLRLIKRGELSAYKIGNQWRVAPKDLEIFLKLRRQA